MKRWTNYPVRTLLTCLALFAATAIACASEQPDPAAPPTLSALAAAGEGRELYPPFDPDILHYAVGCGQEGDLALTLTADDADTRLEVNGAGYSDGNAVVDLTGLTRDGDVVIRLSNGERSATYTVHCLPDDFPTVTARKLPGHSDILITVDVLGKFIAIIDTNGVPRFHRNIGLDTHTSSLKYHANGLYPYSYARKAGIVTDFIGIERTSKEFVILDWDLSEVDIVTVVPPLTHTTHHDFIIKPNGNYVLLSYEPSRRDLSAFSDEDGNPYGATEGTRDSVIQEITPEREQVFLWNSWDHLAIEDCVAHRFPDDYAHINSLELVDGDIVASFRGCSQVLRIDGTSGEIVWLLGRSNRSDADWVASGRPAPLAITNDPHGEFCGQHAARLWPNGNLVLYDNGVACQVDPATGATTRESDVFSRAVEYSLDPGNGRAVFLRHHSLHGTFDKLGRVAGNVALLDNGNWLISWGRGIFDDDPDTPPPPDASITEVDPLTGRELLSITIINRNGIVLHPTGWPVPPDALERRPDAR